MTAESEVDQALAAGLPLLLELAAALLVLLVFVALLRVAREALALERRLRRRKVRRVVEQWTVAELPTRWFGDARELVTRRGLLGPAGRRRRGRR